MRKCTCNKKIIKPKGFLAYIKKKFHQLLDFRLNYVVFNRINLQLRLLPNNTSLIKLLNLVLLYSGKYSSPFYFNSIALVVSRHFKTGRIPMSQINLFLNTIFLRPYETLRKWRRLNIRRIGHIPVYSIMDKDTAKFKCIYFSKLTEEIPSYHNI